MINSQIFTTLVKSAFLGFLFYFCLQFFIPRWKSLQLSAHLGSLSVSWITAAGGFTLAYYALSLLTWRMILKNLGSQPNLQLTIRAYVYSLLPKYIPGNIAAHGLRAQLAFKAGVPVHVSLKSFLLEAVFAVGTAVVITIPGTMYYFPWVLEGFYAWAVIALVLGLAAVVTASRFQNIEPILVSAATGEYVKVVFFYLLVWFVSGSAHWCLANSIGSYDIWQLPKLTVAVAASWALGFVSIFAPAGLGVREAVLYFFVNTWMEQTDILLFVTLSRLLMFGVEVLLTLGVVLYSKISTRRVT